MVAVPTTSFRDSATVSAGDIATVLDFIDELEDGATGNVVFHGHEGPLGAAFVENGRVCWAAARGLARRLTALLARRSEGALDAARVEALVRECHDTGRPLGERLLELGLITAEGLRSALLEHTLDSLRELTQLHPSLSWGARAAGGYSPRFTFSTGELSAAFVATLVPDTARRAAALAERVADADDAVAVFALGERGAPRAVHVRGALCLHAWELQELARMLSALAEIAAAMQGSMRAMTFANSAGGGIAALRVDDLLICAAPADPRGMARSLSRFVAECTRRDRAGSG